MTTGQALVLDMHSLGWKAFYTPGYRSLTNAQGYPSGMFYGTLASVSKLLNRFPRAVRVLCAYDGGYSGRHELFPDYKANHNQDPESDNRKAFNTQMVSLMEFFDAVGFHRLLEYGIEGDDLIAIYAKVWLDAHRKNTAVVVSIDQDFYQLLSLSARMGFFNHRNKKFLDYKNISSEICVPLNHYCYWKALVGDISDNIPRCLSQKQALQFLSEEKFHKRLTPEMQRNFHLVRLPYEYMPPLRQMTNLKVSEPDLGRAEELLKEMNVTAFTPESFALKS